MTCCLPRAPQRSSLLAGPRGTPAGARRIDARLEHLIAEVIRDVYLIQVRAKKEEVVRQVGCAVRANELRRRRAWPSSSFRQSKRPIPPWPSTGKAEGW